ncbi:cadherin-24 isoform X3 [Paramormyrops kingsleyae]|uniref:cadherin-24 isoform X3 n=1 Tax=Paramormyrops kingsleyae TaxID=1676925 RepID=UPI003B969F9A
MGNRVMLLLATLCMWAVLMGEVSVKVIRRRGLGAYAAANGEKLAVSQRDSGLDKTTPLLAKLMGFLPHDLGVDTKLASHPRTTQSNSVTPVSGGKEIQTHTDKSKSVSKWEGRLVCNPNLTVAVSMDVGSNLSSKETRNNTKSPELKTKEERVEKSHVLHHRVDLSLLSNKTRLKPLIKSRPKADPEVQTAAAQGRGVLLNSPRVSNLTQTRGPQKPGPKVNSEPISITQLQKGSVEGVVPFGRSRKLDLVGTNRSQLAASVSTGKAQERPASLGLPSVRDQTAHPPSLVANLDKGVDKGVAEWHDKHFTVRTTLMGQSRGLPDTERSPFIENVDSIIQDGESNLFQMGTTLQSGLSLEPRAEKYLSQKSSTSDVHTDGQEAASSPNHGVQPDISHILKLRPDPIPDQSVHGEKAYSGVTSDSGPGDDEGGLVFQEAESGARSQEVEETRSRSRRSWIWNQFFVIEEYSGPEPVLIGRLHTDMDRGDGRTKYILRGEGAGSVFVIDEKTGNIHVTKPLDREEKDEYRLIATATDRQTDRALEPSSQFIIRVQDINDNPPVFQDGPYSATVPEMANIGTSIIQVTATDADDPTYGNSAKLVYTLTQGQQYFSVDPQTGILRTAVPDLDRERQDQYLVVLQAKDMGGHLGGLSGTTTITVRLSDVNDNPPRFTQSIWAFSVSELAIPGAEVGRISATDADLGDNAKLEYTILEGETGDTFNITGQDQEAVILLNKAVDYESRSSYSFSVEVLNPTVDPRFLRRGPFKDRASVRVVVLDADEPPRFSRARYRLDVSENCPSSCTVGRVSAVDPDTGLSSNIRYSIDPQSDPEALFRIAPDSGLITTAMELDREHEQWHNITIIATQRDSPTQVSRVVVAIETLDVNDNAPELDRQYTTAMCDSAAVGQVVQVLRAIDKDKGGNDTAVHFSIAPESSAALNFSVRESGGPTASLVLLSPLIPLSRSASSPFTLQVPLVLKDSFSGLTSTGTVTVSICPCLRGGARAGEKEGQTEGEWERETVCLPMASSSSSPGLSTAALLAILACVATLLGKTCLSACLHISAL